MYREAFILEDGLTYLNCANMSPLLKNVKEAGEKALERRAAPWKLTAQEWFDPSELLRNKAAAVFGTSEENIALVPSASYGLAVAARNLVFEREDEILVLESQFPSNYYVWQQLAMEKHLTLKPVGVAVGEDLTGAVLNSITKKTKLLSIPNCRWTDGYLLDLVRISEHIKGRGIYLVLDLSQSLGALPIEIDKIDPDFAVSVGYKWMLGPYALSYLYAAPRWHKNGVPLEYSWMNRQGSNDFSALTLYTPEFTAGARRFDMGEYAQFHLLPMAIAAVEQVLSWGPGVIQSHARKLTSLIDDYMRSSGLQTYPHAGHLTSIPLPSDRAARITGGLSEQNIVISIRGNLIRVAPHLYNTHRDIENLLDCFQN